MGKELTEDQELIAFYKKDYRIRTGRELAIVVDRDIRKIDLRILMVRLNEYSNLDIRNRCANQAHVDARLLYYKTGRMMGYNLVAMSKIIGRLHSTLSVAVRSERATCSYIETLYNKWIVYLMDKEKLMK